MIKNILWDFDGVILDSMPIREFGFRTIFDKFDKNLVNKLIDYHSLNGGLSRYVKIRYFYENLLNKSITEKKVLELAENFSIIMKKELINKKYLITDTVNFIDTHYQEYNFHIVSGSDDKELKFLCNELGLSKYFITINGSPTPKNDLVKNVINKNEYKKNETILIGDSFNDYDAAKINNIDFYGFNNEELIMKSKTYIYNFNNFFFFDYGIGEISHSNENKTFFNIREIRQIDYLIFLDSRGLTINEKSFDNTYLNKIMKDLDTQNKTYIAVSRPKNLVTFASLLNFLDKNKSLKFKNLITNLGFVDLTPKKDDLLIDMKKQISYLWKYDIDSEKLSPYKLSTGEIEILYSLVYDKKYISFIYNQFLLNDFNKIYFINTPIIDKKIKIKRKRPIEFFKKIIDTNTDINEISNKLMNSKIIDIKNSFNGNVTENYTNDAVHYTDTGHDLIFKNIIRQICYK